MKKKSRQVIRTLMTDEHASSAFAQSISTCKLFVVVRQIVSSWNNGLDQIMLDGTSNNTTRGFVSKQKYVYLKGVVVLMCIFLE